MANSVNNKQAYAIFIIIILTSVFWLLKTIDNDIFHYLIYGRDIVESGIPYYNTHNIESGLKIVLQEWLFDWIIYNIYSLFSWTGIIVYQIIIYSIIVILLYLLFKKTIIDTLVLFFSLCVSLLPIVYLYSVRAQFISIILLLLQTYFIKTKHNRWIFPLLLLFEINLHGSFWIFHYILILPYFIPWFKRSTADVKSILVTAIYSLPVMLINPYGFDMILYPIRAYNSQLISLGIMELYSFRLFSIPTLYLACIFAFFMWHVKKFNNVEIYLFLGTLLLAVMHKRNLYFIVFGLIAILNSDTVKCIKESKVVIKLKNILRGVLLNLPTHNIFKVATTMILTVLTINACINVNEPFKYTKIINYLNKTNVKEVFTTFNTGTRLEWEGFKVYIDSCPEVFSNKINKNKDILTEYIKINNNPRDNLEIINSYKYVCTDDTKIINTIWNTDTWKLVASDINGNMTIRLFENTGEIDGN